MRIRIVLIYFLLSVIPLCLHGQCTVTVTTTGSLCENVAVIFKAIPTGKAPYTYKWYKNGVPIAGATSATYTDSSPGNYAVVVTDKSGCIITSTVVTIYPNPPIPSFTAPAQACASSAFNFTNTTPNGMATYSWNFGDSTSGNGQNTIHSFLTAFGNSTQSFNVRLTVTDKNGCKSSVTKSVTVTQISDASITDTAGLDFTHCVTEGAKCDIEISNISKTQGINTNYEIDWGDGSAHYKGIDIPTGYAHSYSKTGAYNIAETVTNQIGCKVTKIYNYFCGSNPAGGIQNPGNTNGCAPMTLSFPIQGENNTPGTKYTVSYNDGSPDTSFFQPPPANITHTFKKSSCGYNSPAGDRNSFYVKLEISNPCGASNGFASPIHIQDQPTIKFYARQPEPFCTGSVINFINNSTSCTLSATGQTTNTSKYNWIITPAGWTFSGSNQNSKDINVIFNKEGNFNIKLIVENPCGKDSLTQSYVVIIPPTANAIQSDTNSCTVPFPVKFTNNSTGTNLIYNWSVTPGTGWNFVAPGNASSASPTINFTESGYYMVTLSASNPCGVSIKTFVDTVYFIPSVKLNKIQACDSQQVDLGSYVNYVNKFVITGYDWTILPDKGWNYVSPTNSKTDYPLVYFKEAGNYTIKIKINSRCKADSTKQDIIVYPVPFAHITPKDTTICNGSQVVLYSNTDTSFTYQWRNFGIDIPGATDSSFSVDQPGNYTCVVSSNGCSRESNIINVRINDLTVNVTADKTNILNGMFTTLHGKITNGSGIYTYTWTKGSDLNNPSDSTGNLNPQTANLSEDTKYTLCVTDNVTKCKVCTDININISGGALKTNPEADPIRICFGASSQLNAYASGGSGVYTYAWSSVPAGFSSTNSNPVVNPTITTTYTVTVNDGYNTVKDTVVVILYPRITADFSSSLACLGQSIYFKDLSKTVGGISSWFWKFGDNSLSGNQNPVHYYLKPGNYLIKLIVTNSFNCSDSVKKNIIIDSLPDVKFTNTTACYGDSTFFTNASKINPASIISFKWKFGDGQEDSIHLNVSHKYNFPGIYFASLMITNSNGCSNYFTKEVKAKRKPVAQFFTLSGQNTMPIDFFDRSVSADGKINKWQWDFGNNDTSENQNPTEIFTKPGYYNVTLIVTDNNGCKDTIIQKIYVSTIGIDARFEADTVCLGNITHFKDKSTIDLGVIDKWFWDLGDTTTIEVQNPTHLYKYPGRHSVKLIVYGSSTSDTIIQEVIVKAKPDAKFTYRNNCENQATLFINQSSIRFGNIILFNWDFGNKSNSTEANPRETFTKVGNYDIMLIVTSDMGCKDSISRLVYINTTPLARFKSVNKNGCVPLKVDFSDSLNSMYTFNWVWNFGDNVSSAAGSKVSHTYTLDGLYDVSLKVVSDQGCSDSLTINDYVNVYPKPVADFTVIPKYTTIETPTISFTDRSSGAAKWLWDFGDFSNSNEQSPVHIYREAGKYDITLYIQNQFECKDTVSDSIKIANLNKFFVPTAFVASNANGLNDVFLPLGIFDRNSFEMDIFNRWGGHIFKSTSYSKGWDGKPYNSDQFCPEGVYIWIVKIKDLDGFPHEYKGKVTLLHKD